MGLEGRFKIMIQWRTECFVIITTRLLRFLLCYCYLIYDIFLKKLYTGKITHVAFLMAAVDVVLR